MSEEQQGLTRRQMLKRGAVFGGALVWAVPVVQTIGMTPALAETTSPPVGGCQTHYAIRVDRSGCTDIAGRKPGEGCLDTSGAVEGGCSIYEPAFDVANGLAVPFGCKVKVLDYAFRVEPQSDAGGEDQGPLRQGKCLKPGLEADGNAVTFATPDTELEFSYVEIIFCCDDDKVD
ncbi:MAG TPA: hypothetical protein ENH33_00370 [Actinobacteria bacterium]|nr:hypothetical protein [Actinomycetota bacterium]